MENSINERLTALEVNCREIFTRIERIQENSSGNYTEREVVLKLETAIENWQSELFKIDLLLQEIENKADSNSKSNRA